jgi:hypothetical protein
MYAVRHVRRAEGQIQGLPQYFGYSPLIDVIYRRDFSDDEWISILKQQIDSGLPVYYRGDNEDDSDHAWIIDGYDNNGKFHINWGWTGRNDGWYDVANSDLRGFTRNQGAYINFKPANTIVIPGAGTQGSPYIITTEEQLAFLANQVNGGVNPYSTAYYRLESNIAMTMKNWRPIGELDNPFSGVFDGNGKVISGLSIRGTNRNQGLFGYIAGGTVKNLGLESVNISGGWQVGGIAGNITETSTISNCYTTGTVTGTVNNVGGIVGLISQSTSLVENCYSTAAVSGENMVGGIAGNILGGGTVANSAALNTRVAGTGQYVGRVTGTTYTSRRNNIGFTGILNANGTTEWSNTTLTGNSGEDITAAEILKDSTLGGRFASPIWATENGKLPGFGTARNMPGHIK